MRLLDKGTGTLRAILSLLVGAGLFCLTVIGSPGALAAETDRLDVSKEPGGGVRATAQVFFPAKPAIVQALLTDYQHWPDLFQVKMRVAEFTMHAGAARVDLRIDHSLMPGERRLITESRTLPTGGLVTDLKGGDFKRYHRVWKLAPADGGSQTYADFELVVEIESLVPDWMVAIAMRQELEAHFRIVKQKVVERSNR